MNTALSWIKAYVPDLSCTDQEYFDAMTLTGTKVEGYERMDKNLEKIVIGQIEKIEKHPDADKLIICQVNVGDRTIQIVTGAPNVKEGDKVPVVLDGGKVAGGHDGSPLPEDGIKIKAGKLRGIESDGMMCSIEELGSSRDMYPEAPENGIYIFDDDVEVGTDAVEALGLHDTVFEYEITSNRVDCYSILGIAREAAATFRKPFIPPVVEVHANGENVHDYVDVEVQDTDLCTRYCARVCKNIKIAPSPKWMQRRLAAAGIRPINNLVDITNYVMAEYGQPMHAYDLDTIAGHKIIVRRAKNGDEFETLDGQIRKLDNQVLMICDAEKDGRRKQQDHRRCAHRFIRGCNIQRSQHPEIRKENRYAYRGFRYFRKRSGSGQCRSSNRQSVPADRRAGLRRGSRRHGRCMRADQAPAQNPV